MKTYLLETYNGVGGWRALGEPSTNFGILYRELHACRQHPHGHLRVVRCETGDVIMRCWDNGFIEPFQYGKYSDWTACDADFDE